MGPGALGWIWPGFEATPESEVGDVRLVIRLYVVLVAVIVVTVVTLGTVVILYIVIVIEYKIGGVRSPQRCCNHYHH